MHNTLHGNLCSNLDISTQWIIHYSIHNYNALFLPRLRSNNRSDFGAGHMDSRQIPRTSRSCHVKHSRDICIVNCADIMSWRRVITASYLTLTGRMTMLSFIYGSSRQTKGIWSSIMSVTLKTSPHTYCLKGTCDCWKQPRSVHASSQETFYRHRPTQLPPYLHKRMHARTHITITPK